ncbi:hypothetical protein F2P56_014056 [Juglans regia]|uniref:Uncharacterized protein LOC108995313 n=2 Tax=Juglans regia TaxID=51240 RepID=A0A2I4F414_JUGRE|nr:uncharacterized protein LOC108995313 [Juglans regia]KAF5463933.1 hypothetical protein F2P56_014056 [Juglans regia]
MLPSSIRSMLRDRLKGSIGFSESDLILAREWREALGRILGWFSPLAHNMIKWQSEKSFEQQTLVPKTNMMLLQTLFFVNKEKTEAAITELLVGLNYIWKFAREMIAKALLESTNFNGILNALTRWFKGVRRSSLELLCRCDSRTVCSGGVGAKCEGVEVGLFSQEENTHRRKWEFCFCYAVMQCKSLPFQRGLADVSA